MIELRVPAALECRHLVTAAVKNLCERLRSARAEGLDERFEHELVSAVAEAFNNIVIHAYRDVPHGTVDVRCLADERFVTIELEDRGHHFDLDAVPLPPLDELPEGGMGVFIMFSSVDEVEYQKGPPNRLTLTKQLRS